MPSPTQLPTFNVKNSAGRDVVIPATDHPAIVNGPFATLNVWCPGTPISPAFNVWLKSQGVDLAVDQKHQTESYRLSGDEAKHAQMDAMAGYVAALFHGGVKCLALQEVPTDNKDSAYFITALQDAFIKAKIQINVKDMLDKTGMRTGSNFNQTAMLWDPQYFEYKGKPEGILKDQILNTKTNQQIDRCFGAKHTFTVKRLGESQSEDVVVHNIHGDFAKQAATADYVKSKNIPGHIVLGDLNITATSPHGLGNGAQVEQHSFPMCNNVQLNTIDIIAGDVTPYQSLASLSEEKEQASKPVVPQPASSKPAQIPPAENELPTTASAQSAADLNSVSISSAKPGFNAFYLPFGVFDSKSKENDAIEQAKVILEAAKATRAGNPNAMIGITYSANYAETKNLRDGVLQGAQVNTAFGVHQGDVMRALQMLMTTDSRYQECAAYVKILPITTIGNRNAAEKFDKSHEDIVREDMARIVEFIAKGGCVLGWVNQLGVENSQDLKPGAYLNSNQVKRYAVGGGVAYALKREIHQLIQKVCQRSAEGKCINFVALKKGGAYAQLMIYDSDTKAKVDAANQLLNLLEGVESVQFTKAELKALLQKGLFGGDSALRSLAKGALNDAAMEKLDKGKDTISQTDIRSVSEMPAATTETKGYPSGSPAFFNSTVTNDKVNMQNLNKFYWGNVDSNGHMSFVQRVKTFVDKTNSEPLVIHQSIDVIKTIGIPSNMDALIPAFLKAVFGEKKGKEIFQKIENGETLTINKDGTYKVEPAPAAGPSPK